MLICLRCRRWTRIQIKFVLC